MAEFTPNYNLEKPTGAEKYYISKFNANADKIDEALKGHDDTIAANKTQEEQDISDLRNELQDYADNAVSEHNLSEDDNLHPHIQKQIADALTEAKNYTYSKTETDERISVHNSDESAHQDIRNIISGMGTDVQTNIENAIAVHNASPEAHPDIRTDYANYTNNVVSTHNNDPEAHGGKDVVYTKLAAMGNGFTSSMTYVDIITAFQDGKNVVALLNSGGEVQLETDGANITGKRTVIEGDKMVLETYVLNPETNMFTKTSTKYLLDYAPAIADEAIADVSIIVDPESDEEAAKIGSAIIGQSRIGGGTAMGGADWNAQEGEAGYIANKPFGEIDNGETVIWEGDSSVGGPGDDKRIYYPETATSSFPFLQEGITYTATIGNDSVEFTVPITNIVASKSETFGVMQSMSTNSGYAIEIGLDTSVYTGDTVHLKITYGGATIKKIDPKYIENSFVIDVDLNNMAVNTSADDIRNAVANKMPIYVFDSYYNYISVKNYFVDSMNSIAIYFDTNDNSFVIICENNEVTIDQQKTLTTGFHAIVSSSGKLQFSLITNLSWIGGTTSIIYGDDIYTAVSNDTDVYIYRNEKYGDKVNGVLPLIVSELKVTVLDESGAEVDTNYTIEHTSTIHGIQTVPLVAFMTYDGSSVIGTSTVTNGTPNSIPTAPERTGGTDYTYVHVGWSTEANATNTVSLENITDSMTVYAVYEKKMTGDTINDGWSTIVASTKDGTYKTKYSVGDLKTVDLGTQGLHQMQLVAFDADDKADGSGKAPMTWVMKDLLKTNHRMNPSKVDGQEGTGTLGGYDKTEMKSYLTETILPLFPADIRNNIVPVTKHQKAYDASGTAFQESTTETLWIPGNKEIFNSTSYDADGSSYSDVFKDQTSRIKKRNGSALSWWLRSASDATGFGGVGSSGSDSYSDAGISRGVCPGFCM